VLVPVGLPDAQQVPGRLERGPVVRLVGGVVDGERHVDARFGAKAGHRGRADVLELANPRPERCADARLLDTVALGPPRVVGDEQDGSVVVRRLADGDRHDLVFGEHHGAQKPNAKHAQRPQRCRRG